MWGIDIKVLLAEIAEKTAAKQREARDDLLRRDLNDDAFADWFLSDKIVQGRINPQHALNDFVLFRVAHRWPMGASWGITTDDLASADFSLTASQALDLVEMAQEGLNDGYRPASWYAKVSIVWCVSKSMAVQEPLFQYLQDSLFGFGQEQRQGRNRSDGLDRDLVIRRLYQALVFRNRDSAGAKTRAADTVVVAVGKLGVNLAADAVRQIEKRCKPSEREDRLWQVITGR